MPKDNKDYLTLKKLSKDLGCDLFGVADISKIKNEFLISPKILKNLNRAVSLGVGLSAAILEEIEEFPTRLYFHHYRTINNFLDQLAFKVSSFIQKEGFSAIPIPASQIVDWADQRAHLSHKKIGLLAGIGWIGRNNLLVNERFGSQFRLVSILTDMPLKVNSPLNRNCGSCSLCIKVCPVQAIKEKPQDFEYLKCFEKLKEFQRQKLVDQYICGICVKVCKGKKSSNYRDQLK